MSRPFVHLRVHTEFSLADGIVRTDDLLNAITPRTRLIATSWVNFFHGYVHDLLKHLDPAFAAQVRIVATTDAAPMPPFVATARLTEDEVARLRAAFAASIAAPELRAERETLLLKDFAFPEPREYDVFGGILHAAEQYAEIW